MARIFRRSFLVGITLIVLPGILAAGCGPGASAATEARSSQSRGATAGVPQSDIVAQAEANNAFALDLYQLLRAQNTNLLFSPYSITQALSMALAGARGQTAQQLTHALHLRLPPERLHPAANALDQALARRRTAPAGQDQQDFELEVANGLWGQTGYTLQPAFLDLLAENYGTGLQLLDFQAAPEQARATINARIDEQTRGKIKDLLPPQSITTHTRLVLTNAIYFNAKWRLPFAPGLTHEESFHPLVGDPVVVPMMAQEEGFRYAEEGSCQAIELPYRGGISMVVLLPKAGQFAEFERGLDTATLRAILDRLEPHEVTLTMPKFAYRAASFSLRQSLRQLGIIDAFQPEVADFSGMDGSGELSIDDAHHQATVTVDETGTEAAAASAVVFHAISGSLERPIPMSVDRPFIFLIRDDETGTILFLGRVLDPR